MDNCDFYHDPSYEKIKSFSKPVTDATKWSIDEVCKWLEEIDLSVLVPTFKEQEVNGVTLQSITQDQYSSLDIVTIGRKSKFETQRNKLFSSSSSSRIININVRDEEGWTTCGTSSSKSTSTTSTSTLQSSTTDTKRDYKPFTDNAELFSQKSLQDSLLDTAVNEMYQKLMKSNFIGHFSNLPRLLSSSQFKNQKELQLNCIHLFLVITQKFTSQAYNLLPLELLENQCSQSNDPDILKPIQRMRQQQIFHKEKMEKRDNNSNIPIRYHDLSIFPSKQELRSNMPELNALKVGKYESAEEYLDTQYCLLREDLIQPMREALDDFEAGKSSKYFYHDVVFKNLSCTRSSLSYTIKFKPNKPIEWSRHPRLLQGSLVGLSCDNFNTVIWAVVEDRPKRGSDPKITISILEENHSIHPHELPEHIHEEFEMYNDDHSDDDYDNDYDYENGYRNEKPDAFDVYVQLSRNESRRRFVRKNILSTLFTKSFLMIESPSYFEAYKNVLKSLKDINVDTIPFQQYLLDCSIDTKPPAYILKNPYIKFLSTFDVVEHDNQSIEDWENEISNEIQSFPTKLDELDQSQLNSIEHCLNTEVSLIQGPPGTGKTFIGLKLFELLHRHTKHRDGPVLLISYTNHALDQFVQGCLNTTKNIIRLGNRSKDPDLEQFNIRNHIKRTKSQYQYINEMDGIVVEIRNTLNRMVAVSGKLTFKDLRNLKNVYHLESISYRGKASIHAWLNSCTPILNQQNSTYTKVHQSFPIPKQQRKQQDQLHEEDEMDEEMVEELIESRIFDFGGSRHKEQKEHRDEVQEIDISLPLWIIEQKSTSFKDMYDISNLPLDQRVLLYRHWQKQKIHWYLSKLNDLKSRYEYLSGVLLDWERVQTRIALKSADVVAATTTGASRLKRVIEAVKPRIIIIEEAAEVLESHIVATLTTSAEHLIMIGDHKQLKPSSQVYQLSKKYNLGMSLFERIVKNGMGFKTLEIQRRMVPNISQFVKPVYPHLIDHPSVIERFIKVQKVDGMPSNVFFLDHRHMENSNESSKSNIFEADFVVRLAEYIVQHNYSPNNIAILTPYTGQLILIRSRAKKNPVLEGITIRTVDQFQGEERDFIILSLVRSNNEGSTGFLKIENRINVLLSRARNAMYIVGNSQLLSKANDLWVNLISKLKEEKKLDTFIPLVCVNHPDTITEVRTAADFDNVPEGGCNKHCDARLDCGHQCPRSCHTHDLDHYSVICSHYCEEVYEDCGHQCQSHCHNNNCGPCKTTVETILECGHTAQKYCYADDSSVYCTSPCERTDRDCGHDCNGSHLCGQCDISKCMAPVETTLKCGHSLTHACHDETNVCNVICEEKLPCGHPCKRTCKDHTIERTSVGLFTRGWKVVHPVCEKNCEKLLICGHMCPGHRCGKECFNCKGNCPNRCRHCRCKKLCIEECTPCKEQCIRTANGIRCSKQCGEPCDIPRITVPCEKLLNCGHQCMGLQGEFCTKKCKVCDPEEIEPILLITLKDFDDNELFIQLDCDHMFEVTSFDQYMETKDEIVGVKGCPICKKLIFSNILRYKDIVNENWKVIEKVKERIRHNEASHIVKMSGFTAGHWFNCPNGHLYYIDNCGGAMEVGKCIECKEQVGGTNHKLLSTNSHSNIDGSEKPHYPYGLEPRGFL
ncbi:NF-X1-type Zn finger-containing protein [Heterostelium album PN500]|uniref:NF-X1-type Zn finger-containing protein n=1 Tax=Heterostelium pallidum (strain ATCC 26659 / Pp 5 / PN500) TaxID=670386 RepID=D3BL57_HETP5|nr:NF-X1-type Zn finger-containing protein [Heterostelium album PN500]EFA77791.1 NF-X1-type Zn finger-containing protein [Heterostelium album PN500]|eukprot:XP_020429919.1 NF-X1-type Zn finger-containing protein [Heterostelium album PN500]